MENLRWLFFACLAISGLLYVVGTALVVARRNIYPVSGRSWPLLVAIYSLMQADLAVDLVGHGWGHIGSCWLTLARGQIILVLSSTLLMRVFRLWYLFFGAQEKLRIFREGSEGGDLDDTKETRTRAWFSKRPFFATSLFLWATIGLITVFDIAVVNSVFFGNRGATCTERVASLGPYYFARGALTVSCVVLLFWKIRRAHDAFGIRNEFLLLALGAGPLLAVKGIRFAAEVRPDMLAPNVIIATTLLTWAWYSFYGPGVALAIPLLQSYGIAVRLPECCRCQALKGRVSRRSSMSASELYKLELRQVLREGKYKNERRSFENQLASEFATETIMFYEATTKFVEAQADWCDAKVAERALDIYCNFFVHGAPSEVNVSDGLRKSIRQTLASHIANFDYIIKRRAAQTLGRRKGAVDVFTFGRVPETIFEEARRVIYNLMANDSYTRWISRRVSQLRRPTTSSAAAAAAAAAVERSSVGTQSMIEATHV